MYQVCVVCDQNDSKINVPNILNDESFLNHQKMITRMFLVFHLPSHTHKLHSNGT